MMTATEQRVPASLLVCDDVPEIRGFLRNEMARHPDLMVVGEAATGLEAVEMARQLRPDLVVLDLTMPEMDGREALSKIVATHPGTAVVVLSGLEGNNLEADLLRRGAAAFIHKGATLAEIVSTIRSVIDASKAARSPSATDGMEPETLNRQLEGQVRVRTAELQAKTDELEERSRQLQESVAELEAFTYSVSHDLRAPLRAMDGFSRILLDELADAIPEDKRRYLEYIRKNAQGMQELVDGLLAFSRLGRAALNLRVMDPVVLVRQAISDLGVLADRTDVEIVLGELPSCLADPVLLKQVYVNLIGNALKFCGRVPGGRIEVGADRSDGGVTYFVRDNGVGFDQRFVDQIFGVFQRLHRAEDYEGTGIGLALVQRIITKHGGRIWCEGKVGEGAVFFFQLPGEPAE